MGYAQLGNAEVKILKHYFGMIARSCLVMGFFILKKGIK